MNDDIYTIGQLIEKLQEFDENLPVLLSADAEGNAFSRVNDIQLAFASEGDDDIELIDEEDLQALEEDGQDTDQYYDCIVIWPN